MRSVIDRPLAPAPLGARQPRLLACLGLDAASDEALWSWAMREERIIVSKDEDLFFLANRGGNSRRLLWVRIGNCRRDALHSAFERGMPAVIAAFESGQRVVELA